MTDYFGKCVNCLGVFFPLKLRWKLWYSTRIGFQLLLNIQVTSRHCSRCFHCMQHNHNNNFTWPAKNTVVSSCTIIQRTPESVSKKKIQTHVLQNTLFLYFWGLQKSSHFFPFPWLLPLVPQVVDSCLTSVNV